MPEPDKILRMRSVLQRTGLSRSTVYRKMKDGTFPNQVHISEHCSGWRESAINRWIADPEHYRAHDDKQAEEVLLTAHKRQMFSSPSPDSRPVPLRRGRLS